MTWSPPPPHHRAKQRVFLKDLPQKIKFVVLSEVLKFPKPLAAHWDAEQRVPGQVSLDQQSARPVLRHRDQYKGA